VQSEWLHGLLDSRGLTVAAGTSEIQKNLLAERALGLPREPKPAK
jgi:alkylation response protein AidB-like acyl-CoA dehydrogenase